MTLRVVFFGNSESVFTSRHFAALLDAPCAIAAVVDVPPARRTSTNPLPPGLPNALDVAFQRGIPYFEADSPNAPEFVEAMRALGPDLFIAAGYMLILKEAVLSVPCIIAANFHASLLPHYRGKHPVFWALRNGERSAGLTVHAMDPGIDTGDILYQVKVRTRRDDTVAALYDRIMDRSVPLVARLIEDAARGTIPRRAQPAEGGSYYSSTHEADFRLDWSLPAATLRRYVTATPGQCFTEIRGERVYLLNAETRRTYAEFAPGTLIACGRDEVHIAAGAGVLIGSRVRSSAGEESFAALCRRLNVLVRKPLPE